MTGLFVWIAVRGIWEADQISDFGLFRHDKQCIMVHHGRRLELRVTRISRMDRLVGHPGRSLLAAWRQICWICGRARMESMLFVD